MSAPSSTSSSRSCPFKGLLGVPNEGLHKYRIPVLNIAAVDLGLTVAVAFAISKWRKKSFLKTFIALFVLAEVLHALFCVDTTVIKGIKSVFA
jgi:hypothetical protein